MKTKALIFDCFGVIISKIMEGWIEKNLPFYNPAKIFEKFDLGQIPFGDVLNEFSKHSGKTLDTIQGEIDSNFKINLELVDYIKELKPTYKIILLTNASHLFFEEVVFIEHPWLRDLFDDIIVSSKVGMIKPNKEIFLHCLENNKLKPKEAIFIDDSEKNIKGAEAIGIPSILFKNTEQLRKDLQSLIS